MATSGNIDRTLASWLTLRIRWVVNSQNVSDNTSNVTVTVQLISGNGYLQIGSRNIDLTINGAKYSGSNTLSISQNTTKNLFSKTVNIAHNSDGSKTASISCLVTFDATISGEWWGDRSLSGSATFNTIPRKSTLSVANGTLNTAQTITVTQMSSSYTHTITATCGSASKTICTKSSKTSISFTPPLSWASQNTSGTTVSVTYKITTYSGTTSLGTNSYTKTCTIPSSVKPSCSISVSDAAGYSVYVKGYSKFKITVTPKTAYGSAITSYSVKANGATYTTASVTTSVLASSGNLTITATVTDKRGRTGTATKTITVYDKSTLTASNGTLNTAQTLTIERGTSSFKHTITYTCGSVSGTVCEKTSAESVSFTPPLSLASQNKKGTTVSVKFTTTTFCDDKSIGSSTKTVSYDIPESVKPTVSISTEDTTGVSSIYGRMVKGLSQLKVNLSATKSYGSDIASYSTTVSGIKYSEQSFEVGLIKSTSNISITATVTDNRGRIGTATFTVSGILNYSPPHISKLTVGRCDRSGNPNDKGDHVQVTYSADITPLNNINTAAYTLRYKKSNESDYTTGEKVTGVYSISNRKFIFAADTGYSYDVILTAQDSHEDDIRSGSASTAFTLIHFSDDGTSISFGKVSEVSNLLDCGLDARFREAVYGNAAGLSKLIPIPENADLNTYLETGGYAITLNSIAATIANMPVSGTAGRLFVSNATGEKTPGTGYAYLRQTFIPYKLNTATYERDITLNAQNVWVFDNWKATSVQGGTVLWDSANFNEPYTMSESQTAQLSETVNQQPNGIVIVFSRYSGGKIQNYQWHNFFVPKKFIELHNGYGNSFFLPGDPTLKTVGSKYLYIFNDHIKGNDNNIASATGDSGIAYDNSGFVLRYVIGV